jgi:glycosyltransferase involved in cell wall biosynthesis
MRILISSNAPWIASGYGRMCKEIAPRLQALGHEVAIFAYCGIAHGMMMYNGMLIYPPRADIYGNDVVLDHYKHFNADLLITFADIWVNQPIADMPLRWLPYIPIDCEPPPPPIVQPASKAWRVLVYSKFALEQLKPYCKNIDYIPIGVDTKIYKPMDKSTGRRILGFDDSDFLVGMVAMNKGFRKNFDKAFLAVRSLYESHKNVRFYMHTQTSQELGGLDLRALAAQVGIAHITKEIDQYQNFIGIDDNLMATVFNAFDVLLIPSVGEGFCMPLLEAQACGIPVISTDFAAAPEIIFAGEKIPIWQKELTPMITYQALVHNKDVFNCLERLYHADKQALAKVAVENAAKFDWDLIFDTMWKPYLEKISGLIEEEKKPKQMVEPEVVMPDEILGVV